MSDALVRFVMSKPSTGAVVIKGQLLYMLEVSCRDVVTQSEVSAAVAIRPQLKNML